MSPRRARWGLDLLVGVLCLISVALIGASSAAAQPSNDDFNSPAAASLNVLLGQDNGTATTQQGELTVCSDTNNDSDFTLWYRIPGTGGPITVSTDGSNFDTVLAVYRDVGDPTNPSNNITCNDNFPGISPASQLTFTSTAGANYLIQILGCISASCVDGSTGHIQLTPLSN